MPTAILLPGTGPGTGPYLPPALHSAGVSGFNHRWVADRVDGAVNSLPMLVPDLVTTSPLHLTSSTNAATRIQTNGTPARRILARTAAAGAVSGALTNATAQTYVPTTVAAVVRCETLSQVFIRVQGVPFRRASNGAWQWYGSLTGGQTVTGSSNWALVFGHLNHGPNTLAMSVDGGALSAYVAFTTAAATSTYIGNSSATTCEVAEVITWPSLLDATARAAVRTALKAHYSFLP